MGRFDGVDLGMSSYQKLLRREGESKDEYVARRLSMLEDMVKEFVVEVSGCVTEIRQIIEEEE